MAALDVHPNKVCVHTRQSVELCLHNDGGRMGEGVLGAHPNRLDRR